MASKNMTTNAPRRNSMVLDKSKDLQQVLAEQAQSFAPNTTSARLPKTSISARGPRQPSISMYSPSSPISNSTATFQAIEQTTGTRAYRPVPPPPVRPASASAGTGRPLPTPPAGIMPAVRPQPRPPVSAVSPASAPGHMSGQSTQTPPISTSVRPPIPAPASAPSSTLRGALAPPSAALLPPPSAALPPPPSAALPPPPSTALPSPPMVGFSEKSSKSRKVKGLVAPPTPCLVPKDEIKKLAKGAKKAEKKLAKEAKKKEKENKKKKEGATGDSSRKMQADQAELEGQAQSSLPPESGSTGRSRRVSVMPRTHSKPEEPLKAIAEATQPQPSKEKAKKEKPKKEDKPKKEEKPKREERSFANIMEVLENATVDELKKFIRTNHYDLTKLAGPLNKEGQTALHIACARDADRSDPEVIKYLVKIKGMNVNGKDERGWTPLHLVCQTSADTRVISLLIHEGADGAAPNVDGTRPLDYYVRHNPKDIEAFAQALDLLLKSCNVNIRNLQSGETALHCATRAMNNTFETIKMLLARGADPSVQNAVGDTPLHYAIRAQRTELVELMLNNGADPRKTGSTGNSIDMAEQLPDCKAKTDILALLNTKIAQLQSADAETPRAALLKKLKDVRTARRAVEENAKKLQEEIPKLEARLAEEQEKETHLLAELEKLKQQYTTLSRRK